MNPSYNASAARKPNADNFGGHTYTIKVREKRGDDTRTCLMLVNAHAESRTISGIAGLRGQKAELFLTPQELDMAAHPALASEAGTLSDPLRLPPLECHTHQNTSRPPSCPVSQREAGREGELDWTGLR